MLSTFASPLPSPSGMGTPRRESSIPWRITRKPLPPASTTPAFFRTGFISVVCSRASCPSAMAASSTASGSLGVWRAASAALAAVRRETVRMVPSAGFITAL
ncbi:Uncharacterised protein [Flavonifractor plautii]|uniref:Uncharacterized protein n=1 Tax=Flavonifractor plautii TaxID=292800 RepID=A0A174KSU4_FLAPL|nr:Uncharacterised protein [Flavonifractor plautii]